MEDLLKFLLENAYITRNPETDEPFTFASGKKSWNKFDLGLGRVVNDPDYFVMVGDYLLSRVPIYASVIAAVEGGGVVLMEAILQANQRQEFPRNLTGISVSKQGMVTGQLHTHNHRGVVLVEDVATTGGSIHRAAQALLQGYNATVQDVLCVFDREEGAEANLKAQKIRLISLLNWTETGLPKAA